MLTEQIKKDFLAILGEELLPAMGCTEPISLAFASARGREILGGEPERIVALCSGNIIKNVRCVRIPNSDGMTGIEAACVLGALVGDASLNMEVLSKVDDLGRRKAIHFLREGRASARFLDSPISLHFIIELYRGDDQVKIEVRHSHTNIVSVERNGVSLFRISKKEDNTQLADRSELCIDNIFDFSETVELESIMPFVERQIECNMAIANEGMTGRYGIGIGKAILETYSDDAFTKARAYAAAASEARMDGCDLPVIITSGSGNQGIASTVPLIVFAREKNISKERLARSLVFSSLLTVYQKEYIGKLSAFCGAISASCASGAAITYMVGGTLTQIKDTIDNTLADIPGVICDGAKASCAAKISSALDAALFAHALAMKGKVYASNTGIIRDDTGETISWVGHIGKVGMKTTDQEIVKLMVDNRG